MTGPRSPSTDGRFRWLLGGAVLLLLLLLGVAGAKGYRDLAAVRERKAASEVEIQRLEAEVAALERRVEHLRDDPATAARLARERLGMVAPGEIVVILPPAPAPVAEPPVPPATPATP